MDLYPHSVTDPGRTVRLCHSSNAGVRVLYIEPVITYHKAKILLVEGLTFVDAQLLMAWLTVFHNLFWLFFHHVHVPNIGLIVQKVVNNVRFLVIGGLAAVTTSMRLPDKRF